MSYIREGIYDSKNNKINISNAEYRFRQDRRLREKAHRGLQLGPRQVFEDLLSRHNYNLEIAYKILCQKFPSYSNEKFKEIIKKWELEMKVNRKIAKTILEDDGR